MPGKAPNTHDALGLAHSVVESAYEQHVSAHEPLTQSPELHWDPVLHEEPPLKVGGDAGFDRPSHVGSTQYCPPVPDAQHTVPDGQSADVQHPSVQKPALRLLGTCEKIALPTLDGWAQTWVAQSFALLHVQRRPMHDASGWVEASLGPPLLLLLPLDPPLPELDPLLDPEPLPLPSPREEPSGGVVPPSLRSGTE